MNEFLILFWVFFKTGLFSFGGGTAMLPLIYQSVSGFGIMDSSEFSNMVALSQVTPGPVAVNAATYTGFYYGGFLGALVATIGVCLPCFLIMLLTVRFIDKFRDNRFVSGAFQGIRPMTIGLILSATIFIAEGVLVKGSLVSTAMGSFDYYNWIAIGIFVLSILLSGIFKVKPLVIMGIAAFAGATIYGFIL